MIGVTNICHSKTITYTGKKSGYNKSLWCKEKPFPVRIWFIAWPLECTQGQRSTGIATITDPEHEPVSVWMKKSNKSKFNVPKRSPEYLTTEFCF